MDLRGVDALQAMANAFKAGLTFAPRREAIFDYRYVIHDLRVNEWVLRYRELLAALPGHIEARFIQLPGREGRWREPALTNLGEIADRRTHVCRSRAAQDRLADASAYAAEAVGAVRTLEALEDVVCRPETCGVTIHLVDAGIDTGAVLAQAPICPSPRDNFTTWASDGSYVVWRSEGTEASTSEQPPGTPSPSTPTTGPGRRSGARTGR